MDSPLMTMDEAAAFLRVSRASLYEQTRNRARIRQAKPLPHIRIGKRIIFRRESLEQWLKELENVK